MLLTREVITRIPHTWITRGRPTDGHVHVTYAWIRSGRGLISDSGTWVVLKNAFPSCRYTRTPYMDVRTRARDRRCAIVVVVFYKYVLRALENESYRDSNSIHARQQSENAPSATTTTTTRAKLSRCGNGSGRNRWGEEGLMQRVARKRWLYDSSNQVPFWFRFNRILAPRSF